MKHTVMAFVFPLQEELVDGLRQRLGQIGVNPAGNAILPFARLGSVHFSSFSILQGPQGFKPSVIWENNFDGTFPHYLDTVLADPIVSAGVDQILRSCVGYPGQPGLRDYLSSHAVPGGLYHIGAVGRTVHRIKAEASLREFLKAALSGAPQRDPVAAARHLRAAVAANPDLRPLLSPEPKHPLLDRIWAWLQLVLSLAALLLAVPLDIVLRIGKEPWDEESHVPLSGPALQAILDAEDKDATNHMVSLTEVKPGITRRLTMRLLIWAGNKFVRRQYKGTLGGIPGIHYAHWSLIQGDRWLLFHTNYSGSWASYLDDFIELAAKELSSVWSNTLGFPKTRWLLFGGAKNGPLFKTFARRSQTPALVWYAAYPKLTVQNVNKNSDIRNGLSIDENDKYTLRAWLRKI